jgi:site-specific DNA recombinase
VDLLARPERRRRVLRGNIDRPALRRLLVDVEAGRVEAVVVYKVDRLSRSLLDFAKLVQAFDAKKVSFVSVTQQFNTAASMDRLVLNVLLSFARFEREIIGERTRDKMAASRRKGKWTGGVLVLRYDVDRERLKLIVDEMEAERVRQIFQLYLDHEGLLPVVQELNRRGWRNKAWTTRKGVVRGGRSTRHRCTSSLLASSTSARFGTRPKFTPASTRASSTRTCGRKCRWSSPATAGPAGRWCGTSTARS